VHHNRLAVCLSQIPRYLGLAYLSIALICLPLSPASLANPENADAARVKQEYNQMKSEAALFNAYMEQLARVDATDFGNDAAVKANLERLDRFKPDDVSRGFLSSLIVAATQNAKFRAGIKQKAEEPGAKEFFEAMEKDSSLVKQIPSVDAAEQDLVRFSDSVKAKVASVKEKLAGKVQAHGGSIDTGDSRFAGLETYLGGAKNLLSALFLVGAANAEVVATILTLLFILSMAGMIIVIIGEIVAIIWGAYMIWSLLDRIAAYYRETRQSYSNCYYSALRNNTAYWNQEFAKAGCWIAFFGDW